MSDSGLLRDVQVGFIGLGSQGAPMARQIAESGFPLTVWARRRASIESFAAAGAAVAAIPAEVGAASDVVGICVVSDADVMEVALGPEGVLSGMSEGDTLVVHATVHPQTCLDLARSAAEFGVSVVDAPVSGGGAAAAECRLLVMVGGDEADVNRCRPVFESFGNPIVHLGPLGSGELAKLLNNLAFAAHVGGALELFDCARDLDIDPLALSEVLAHGSGGSRAQSILAATQFDLAGLRQARPILRKDIDLAAAVIESRGIPGASGVMRSARHALEQLEEAS